jgi:MFS family permease
MNSAERLFTFKVSLIMGARMLGFAMGIFSTSQFLGTFFGSAIGGLIYNIYDLNSVFLLTIFVAIIWWFLMITLPHTVKSFEE